MGVLGFSWGLGGVLALLVFAMYRLTPMAFELTGLTLNLLQWALLLLSMGYMAYAEGYQGFHKNFSPRVVVRANYLLQHPRLLPTLLAPVFCMGYIYATPKRMVSSIGLTLMIIGFVLIVRMLPQPWRGIVDAGVVLGLFLGICSVFFYLVKLFTKPESLNFSADIPDRQSADPTV